MIYSKFPQLKRLSDFGFWQHVHHECISEPCQNHIKIDHQEVSIIIKSLFDWNVVQVHHEQHHLHKKYKQCIRNEDWPLLLRDSVLPPVVFDIWAEDKRVVVRTNTESFTGYNIACLVIDQAFTHKLSLLLNFKELLGALFLFKLDALQLI